MGANTLDASAFTGRVTLDGAGADDVVVGGPSHDSLVGGSGNDTLTGALGDDFIAGGSGALDRLVEAGDVNFTLTDTLLTGLGTDTLSGIELIGLSGGPGDNNLNASGFAGPVTLLGEGGNDTLVGTAGADSLLGGPGNDSLVGGANNDTLAGAEGDDLLAGEAGDDNLDGGADSDVVAASGDVNFNLSDSQLTGVGADALAAIERANLTGGPGSNSFVLSPWSGSATVAGGDGDDTLTLGSTAADDVFSVSDSAITRTSGANTTTVDFTGLEFLALEGGDGDDVFSILPAPLRLAGGIAPLDLSSVKGLSLTGGAGDDTFNLVAMTHVPVSVDGGEHNLGDRINFDGDGQYVLQGPNTLSTEGRQPVTHSQVEIINVLNFLYRVFLAFVWK